jgi:hypothetical protein
MSWANSAPVFAQQLQLPESPFAPISDGQVTPVSAQEAVPAEQGAPQAAPAPTATSVLTEPVNPSRYPAGTVTSPWCGADGCCGPTGGNGLLTYELYSRTGPSLPVQGGGFIGRLNTGWVVEAGVRTLFFNTEADAAWVVDVGLSYTYNRGRQQRNVLQVYAPQPRDFSGNLTGPDRLEVFGIRGLHRTNFNIAIGRDWFAYGPATVGSANRVNWRYGGDIGFRWGTSHVDLVPQANERNYLRRTGITDSIFFGGHVDREVNFGNWIFFNGLRMEYDYTWTNVIPDHNGDIVSLNFLMYAGVRF